MTNTQEYKKKLKEQLKKTRQEYKKKLEEELKELKDRNARITLQIMKMRSESIPALYRAGTMGPSDDLLSRDGRFWIDPKDEDHETS